MSTEIIRFDYGAIEPSALAIVREETAAIRECVKRSALEVIEIGRRLGRIKDALPHGQFGPWLKAEFDWSQDTAQRFMSVARRFGDIPHVAEFAPSALYALSAPSVPEEARQEAVALATNGQHVTHADAKRIIESKKPPKAEPTPKPKATPAPAPKPKTWTAPEAEGIDFGEPPGFEANGHINGHAKPEPAPEPERPTNKTRVNGVLTDDPPEIARLRAAGKIAPGVVPEIEEPGEAEATPEPEPAPKGEDELTDEEWLETLPARAKLPEMKRRHFDADALEYRRLGEQRKAFQYHASRILKSRGEYGYWTRFWLSTDHPRHWKACPPLDQWGCGGTGEVPLTGECKLCRGRGYFIRPGQRDVQGMGATA